MKITIFGATGATGQPTVQQALAAGHQVTAFARTPSHVPMADHPNLTIVQGDALNAVDVAKAIQADTDVVISTLGHRRGGEKSSDLLSKSMAHIVGAMQAKGVTRLIVMSGAGVWIEGHDNPGILEHIIRFALKTLSGHVLEDSEQMVRYIMESGLDWTIPRAPRMVVGEHTQTYRVGYLGKNAGTTISYADMADFIVHEITASAYSHQAPVISY